MSHRATLWALKQRNLRPAVKMILIGLAARYDEQGARFCITQADLSQEAGISRATLNRHLNQLEGNGMISRVHRHATHPLAQLSSVFDLPKFKSVEVSE